MLRWLRSLFVAPRAYKVWIWAERRWWYAGTVHAGSWAGARNAAARKHPGYLIQVREVE